MATTQEHLPIQDIQGDLVILKDSSLALILETSAVNFGLLSEREQLSIISGFAGLLNSLSFSIQIMIRSKRLNVTSYLEKLEEAHKKQSNPLLASMILRYKNFISQTVKENDVLDKQFFIIIPLSYLELGLTKNSTKNSQKALTILIPRRDHIIRQLWRIGLRAQQLNSAKLIELFYDIYNPSEFQETVLEVESTNLNLPLASSLSTPNPPAQMATTQPSTPPITSPQATTTPKTAPIAYPSEPRTTTPFVVEELED
ncbi:hypothetical protein HYS91_01760 [Candidatus Daviesbacteria bacterium]|nr:hypothetical protein [Candidatus Daviesbacteria bacterium]